MLAAHNHLHPPADKIALNRDTERSIDAQNIICFTSHIKSIEHG